jgi:probable phosphoglycerate mutase
MSRRSDIFFVRHGETHWNVEGRFQGQSDSALTDRGRRQAAQVGDRLYGLLGERAFTLLLSPLGRAQETAWIGASRFPIAVSQIVDPRLVEVILGAWDGVTMTDIDALWPGALDGGDPFDWYFRAPDGESFEAVQARAQEWLFDVGTGAGPVIAISHGLTGRVIRGVFAGLDQGSMLRLPVSQSALWQLHGGTVTEIEL